MPSTHFSASSREAAERSLIESSRFRAIRGTNTFSSKWPCMPPIAIAWSLPITCAATCVTTSGITGFTLPGMIDEPFCSSGRKISARPARGPEPRKRRSFAIFVSETATTFSAPDASTSPSRAACDSNGSAGGLVERGEEVGHDAVERGEVHRRREDVVRALAHVDVVVRVDVFACERRDHLVRVHVGRRAGAGLEDVDRELIVELPVRDSLRG